MQIPSLPFRCLASIGRSALVVVLACAFAALLPSGGLRAETADESPSDRLADVWADTLADKLADTLADKLADTLADKGGGDRGGKDPEAGEPAVEDGGETDDGEDVWDGPTSFTRAQADKAIVNGVRYLRSRQQASGTWGETQGDGIYGSSERKKGYGHPAGCTALALYALLKCKVPEKDGSVRKGFEYLKKANLDIPQGTYECAALLLAVTSTADTSKTWRSQKARPKLKGAYRTWATKLVDEIEDKQRGLAWRYQVGGQPANDGHDQDLSSTQLVALSLFAADRVGIRVKDKLWENILEFSMLQQETDGPAHKIKMKDGKELTVKQRGFSYIKGYGDSKHGDAIGSMTACGLANIAMARHILTSGGDPKQMEKWNKRPDAEAVQASLYDSLAWLEDKWSPFANPKSPHNYYLYWLYSIERAMDLVGLSQIGTHLWYSEMGQQLIDRQEPNGAWNSGTTHRPEDVLDTCFALLFLKRATEGSIPWPSITGGNDEPVDNR